MAGSVPFLSSAQDKQTVNKWTPLVTVVGCDKCNPGIEYFNDSSNCL